MGYNRQQEDRSRPRVRLERGADGRLRSIAGDTEEIGDVWAEQRRIRLAEVILQDKKKAEKKKRRAGSKLIGLLKKRTTPNGQSTSESKELVFNISLPKLRLPSLRLPRLGKRRLIIGAAALSTLVLGAISYAMLGDKWSAKQEQAPGGTVNSTVIDKGPDYQTVLPAGKSIRDLGGWARVSPPDKDPVYAFVDDIESVRIRVSQQPLPEMFKDDPQAGVAEVAKQFAASETIQVDGNTVYIGTSEKGPQSVVLSKNNLLILIKSDAKISNDQWAGYTAALR